MDKQEKKDPHKPEGKPPGSPWANMFTHYESGGLTANQIFGRGRRRHRYQRQALSPATRGLTTEGLTRTRSPVGSHAAYLESIPGAADFFGLRQPQARTPLQQQEQEKQERGPCQQQQKQKVRQQPEPQQPAPQQQDPQQQDPQRQEPQQQEPQQQEPQQQEPQQQEPQQQEPQQEKPQQQEPQQQEPQQQDLQQQDPQQQEPQQQEPQQQIQVQDPQQPVAQEQAKEADNGTKELVENEKKEEAVVEEGTEEEDVGEMPDAAAYFSDDYDDRDVMSDRVDGIEAGGLLHGVLPQTANADVASDLGGCSGDDEDDDDAAPSPRKYSLRIRVPFKARYDTRVEYKRTGRRLQNVHKHNKSSEAGSKGPSYTTSIRKAPVGKSDEFTRHSSGARPKSPPRSLADKNEPSRKNKKLKSDSSKDLAEARSKSLPQTSAIEKGPVCKTNKKEAVVDSSQVSSEAQSKSLPHTSAIKKGPVGKKHKNKVVDSSEDSPEAQSKSLPQTSAVKKGPVGKTNKKEVVDSSEDSSEAQSKSLPQTSAVKKGPVGKTNKKEVVDSSEDSSEAQSKSLPQTSAVKKGPVGKTNKKEVVDSSEDSSEAQSKSLPQTSAVKKGPVGKTNKKEVVDSSEDSSEAQSKSLPHTSAVKKGPVGKTNKKEAVVDSSEVSSEAQSTYLPHTSAIKKGPVGKKHKNKTSYSSPVRSKSPPRTPVSKKDKKLADDGLSNAVRSYSSVSPALPSPPVTAGSKCKTVALWYCHLRRHNGLYHPMVKGYDFERKREVSSSFIVKRITGNVLLTKNGTRIHLEGDACRSKQEQEGWPPKYIAIFRKSFPPTWRQWIECVAGSLASEQKDRITTPVPKAPAASAHRSTTPVPQAPAASAHRSTTPVPQAPATSTHRSTTPVPQALATSTHQSKKNVEDEDENDDVKEEVVDSAEDDILCGFRDGEWTAGEKRRLMRAISEIPPHTSGFWNAVSHSVGTRSAEACQSHHQDTSHLRAKKSTARQKTTAPAATAKSEMTVSANVGTLKRKRQIRDILDRQDADYQDDFVGATASRKRLTVKQPVMQDDDEGDDSIHTSTDEDSEEDDDFAPLLKRRKKTAEVDRYIHQLQSKPRPRLKTSTRPAPSPKKRQTSAVAHSAGDLLSVLAPSTPKGKHFLDSSQSEDEYFDSD